MNPRVALLTCGVVLAGCASEPAKTWPTSDAHGATLRLVTVKNVDAPIIKAKLELKNGAPDTLQYEHWFSKGPEPVPYCRNAEGRIRICAARIVVLGGEPFVHETYLQAGRSVKFDAVPSRDEQVGVKYWIDGQEQYLWLSVSQIVANLQKGG